MKRKTDKVEQDTVLLNFYKQLIKFRKNNSVLVHGEIDYTLIDDKNICFAYSRFNEESEIVVVFNKSTENKTLTIPVKKNGNFVNAFAEEEQISTQTGKIIVEMPAMTAKIFVLK